MIQENSIKLNTKKTSFLGSISFALLCIYIFLCYVGHIDWIPEIFISISLYLFVLIAAFTILMNNKIIFSPYFKFYGIFTLLCLIGYLYSYSPETTWDKSIDIVKVWIFTTLMYNIIDSKIHVERILSIFGLASMFLFIYLLFTNQLIGDDRLGQELTGNANIFAGSMMFAAISSVYLIFIVKNKKIKIIAIIFFFIQMLTLVLSGGRKYFVLPVILFLLMFIVGGDKKYRKNIILKSFGAILIAILVFWLIMENEFLYDAIGYRMEGLINLFLGTGKIDKSTGIRMWMIDYGLDLWLDKPILGHGIDTFKVFNINYGYYSHNNYIELLSGAGILGFCAYYLIHGFIIVKLLQRKQTKENLYWLFALIILLVFDYGAVTYYSFEMQNFIILILLYLKFANKKQLVY